MKETFAPEFFFYWLKNLFPNEMPPPPPVQGHAFAVDFSFVKTPLR